MTIKKSHLFTATALLVSILLGSTVTQARPPRSQLKPLFFQADKNNVQVLSQRFEYALVDENRLQIGDVLIDASQLNFNIVPGENGSSRLRFRWPAGLLMEGDLLIKDNAGKAIFSAAIDREKVKLVASEDSTAENLRNGIAEYLSPELSPTLLEDMKYLPYMTFCVFRAEANTRIYLCSKELYIGAPKNAGAIQVKSRTVTTHPSQVDINGKIVGDQGIILLNNPDEDLLLKAYSQSGAILEIETRVNAIDFKDVIGSEDGKALILTAAGAEPVDSKKVHRIGDDEWQIRLPLARPFLYLKGDGGIPMRQEFLVKGELPNEKSRVYIDRSASSRTYSSEIRLKAYLPPQARAKVLDKSSDLQADGGDEFQWTLHDIIPGEKNRRYLEVENGDRHLVVGYDVSRGKPFEAAVGADYRLPSGLINAHLHFSWWIEDFLFMSGPLTHLKWGLDVSQQQQHINSKDGEAKVDLTTFELMYRFNSGFYHEDETWGLSLPYQRVKAEVASVSLMGIGLFVQRKAPTSYRQWLSWYHAKLNYFLPSSGTDLKVKQAYKLEFTAYRPIGGTWFLNYAASLGLYKFDPATAKESNQLGLLAGVAYQF